MTSKRIIFSNVDNSVGIIVPAPHFVAELEIAQGMTEIQAVEFIRDKDLPQGSLRPEIIDVSLIPSDRSRRNKWVRHAFGPPIIPPEPPQ